MQAAAAAVAAAGDRMDGWMEGHCVPPARCSNTHIVPGGGRVVIYDSRAPASRRRGTGRGRCDVPAARFSENVKSNMHETVMGGWSSNFLLPRSPSLHSPSLSWKTRSTNRAASPSELGELKVATLWGEEQSYIIYNISTTRHHLNKYPSFNANLGETPSTPVQRRTFA